MAAPVTNTDTDAKFEMDKQLGAAGIDARMSQLHDAILMSLRRQTISRNRSFSPELACPD